MPFSSTNCDQVLFPTNIMNFNTMKVIIILYIPKILLCSPGKHYVMVNVNTQNKTSPRKQTSATKTIYLVNSGFKSEICEVNPSQCKECGLLIKNVNPVKVNYESKR